MDKKVLIEIDTMWADEPLIAGIGNALSKGNVSGKIKDIRIVN